MPQSRASFRRGCRETAVRGQQEQRPLLRPHPRTKLLEQTPFPIPTF